MTTGPQRKEMYSHVLVSAAGLALYWFGVMQGVRIPIIYDALYGFHLMGHLLGFWLPTTYEVMAGSLTQVLIPIGLAGYFLLVHRDFRGVSLMCAFASLSANQVSRYIADAPYEFMTIGPGHNVHDWAVALGESGLNQLAAADELAWIVQVISLLAMLGMIGFGVWGVIRVLLEQPETEKLNVYLDDSAARVKEQAHARQKAASREFEEHSDLASVSTSEMKEPRSNEIFSSGS